jgi:hypothetical protein
MMQDNEGSPPGNGGALSRKPSANYNDWFFLSWISSTVRHTATYAPSDLWLAALDLPVC